jgi:hypothetical protein
VSRFTITTPQSTISLRPTAVKRGEKANGTATYSVTNKSGNTIRTALRVRPDDGTDASWFSVRDGDEKDIAPGATESFSVDLAVPGGTGKHSFSAVAINVADPDNDYEAGSTVAFDAPALEPGGGGVKWWMIAAPVAVLLVVGGVIGYFLWPEPAPETVTLANYETWEIGKAEAAARAQGFEVSVEKLSATDPTVDRERFWERRVSRQTPKSDGTLAVPLSETVTLGWEWQPVTVTVPEVVDKAFGPAVSAIENAGLRYVNYFAPPGNQPSNRHVAVVGAVDPTGPQPAETGVTFTMKWKELPRLQHAEVAILNQEFVMHRDTPTRPQTPQLRVD